MTTEQRFAWMESMLDTTITCYETHREALEKVYADLYRLHSRSGCIHLAPAEAEQLLRGIADVLEKNALMLPAFEGSGPGGENLSSRDNSLPEQQPQQQQQLSQSPEKREATATKTSTAATSPAPSQRSGAPPSAKEASLNAPARTAAAAATPSNTSATAPSQKLNSSQRREAEKANGDKGHQSATPAASLHGEPQPSCQSGVSDKPRSEKVATAASEKVASSFRSPEDGSIPPPSSTGRNGPSSHTPSQVDRNSAKPASRRSQKAEEGSVVNEYESDDDDYANAGSVSQVPPPGESSRDASTEQQQQQRQGEEAVAGKTPLQARPNRSSFTSTNNPAATADNSVDGSANPWRAPSTHSRLSSNVGYPQQLQQQRRRMGSGDSSVDNHNLHGKPSPPPPANIPTAQHKTPSIASSQQSRSNATNNNNNNNQGSVSSSQRQQQRPLSSSATPSQQSAVAAAPSARSANSGMHKDSNNMDQVNNSSIGAATPSEHRRTKPGVPLSPWPIDEKNNRDKETPSLADQFRDYRRQQAPPSAEDPLRNPYTANRRLDDDKSASEAPSQVSDSNPTSAVRNTINATPINNRQPMLNESQHASRPRSAVDESKVAPPSSSASAAAAPHHSGAPATYTNEAPDGMISSVAHRLQPQTKQQPSANLNNSNGRREWERSEPSPSAADGEEESGPVMVYDPPMPKSLTRHHALRTATPRRAAGDGNDSRQVQELVYKRRLPSSGRQAVGGPVLEDDPAVEDFMDSENARLTARKNRELKEIRSAPGCLTAMQRKRSQSGGQPVSSAMGGALVVAANGALTTTTTTSAKMKPAKTAAEEQLTKELQVLQLQMEKMQHEWAISTSKMKEVGNEPRYRQLQNRMARVRADMERVERELATVQMIEAKRARGIPISRSVSRAKS